MAGPAPSPPAPTLFPYLRTAEHRGCPRQKRRGWDGRERLLLPLKPLPRAAPSSPSSPLSPPSTAAAAISFFSPISSTNFVQNPLKFLNICHGQRLTSASPSFCSLPRPGKRRNRTAARSSSSTFPQPSLGDPRTPPPSSTSPRPRLHRHRLSLHHVAELRPLQPRGEPPLASPSFPFFSSTRPRFSAAPFAPCAADESRRSPPFSSVSRARACRVFS